MELKKLSQFIGKIGYAFAKKLPPSDRAFSFGSKKIRALFVKMIVRSTGYNINVEPNVVFHPDLVIGNNSGIGQNSFIGKSVEIGDNVMMGQDCLIYTSNHETSDINKPMNTQGFTAVRPVVIEDDVWIGARVIILPGVHIGTGCVIGAGSVVTHSVAPYCVVAGNPARVIKRRG